MKFFVRIALISLFIISSSFCLKGQSTIWLDTAARTAIWKKVVPFFSPLEEFRNKFGTYRSPLKFYDGHLVKTRDDWEKRREEILSQWHKMMGEWPPLMKNQRMKFLDSVNRENFTQYRISFKWTPNERTEGYLLMPRGNRKMPAVIVVYYEPETAIGLGEPASISRFAGSNQGEPNRDFAYQLAKRGFVALSIGTTEATKDKIYSLFYPNVEHACVQPLSMLAYAAANAWYVLSKLPTVDSMRIGIMGHSFGGKWAMFASCLFDKFACAVWSDPGIVFDESKPNVNYWEPWYLGYSTPPWRKRGNIIKENPATGLYPKLIAEGYDLHELHALMAPRPFLVSGGSEDTIERWIPLNHSIAVNNLLGYENRVAMTNRSKHSPTPESNEQAYIFFEYFLKYNGIFIK